MHYLTFGTVASIKDFGDSVPLMVADWNCTDADGRRWDYASVPEPIGWSYFEDENGKLELQEYTDAVFFNHEDIEKIFFIGPPNEGNLELEKEAYEDAIKKDLPIAKFYANSNDSELEVSFDFVDRKEPYLRPTKNKPFPYYFPLGTVCTIDVSSAEEEELELRNVMVVAVKPYYLANNCNLSWGVDYRVMFWDLGYLATNEPICINRDDILQVVSLGYVDANIQLMLQSELVTNEKLWEGLI